MKISSFMTRNVTCISATDSLKEAYELMQDGAIRHLPVVDDNNILVGILSDRDILLRSELQGDYVNVPDIDVGLAMTTPVITCRPSHEMHDVAAIMLERKIDSIPVADALGELVGIITSADFIEFATKRPIFDMGGQKTLPFHFTVNRFKPEIHPSKLSHGPLKY